MKRGSINVKHGKKLKKKSPGARSKWTLIKGMEVMKAELIYELVTADVIATSSAYATRAHIVDLFNQLSSAITRAEAAEKKLDEQREFIEKIGDAVFKSAEVGNSKMESIEKELAETKAQYGRLREAMAEVRSHYPDGYVVRVTEIIDSVLAETPAQSLARIQAQAIRKAVVSIGTKKRYTANEVVAIMRDKADRLEQEADGR